MNAYELKYRVRHQIRLVLVFGLMAGLALFLLVTPKSFEAFGASLVVGILSGVPIWLLYRVGRFVIGR